MCRWFAALALSVTLPAVALGADTAAIVDNHIMPGYRELATEAEALTNTAQADCAPDSAALRAAYGSAFDAWVQVSHLRFGPSETDDRAFALAFWPDPRGSSPKALGALLREQDPAAAGPDSYRDVSVAARGFYALEFLLYDPQFATAGEPQYHCTLIRTITADIAATSAAILADWENGYADLLRTAGANETYRSPDEADQQLFTMLSAGLEFAADTRLGRPLGTFDHPRPNRAEARRSGRSLRHVRLSLQALQELAYGLSDGDADLDNLFEQANGRADALNDPVFAGVSEPQARFRVEALRQAVNNIRLHVADQLGPKLGVSAGFNSMDGD